MHSGCPHLSTEAHQVAHLLERGSREQLPTLDTGISENEGRGSLWALRVLVDTGAMREGIANGVY
eukprot:1813153-Rhodomonas_salina.1